MLSTLRIRRLAIIEDVTIEFGPGLNLLTGETGAGKSILVGALGLVTGERGDPSRVRSGADRAWVEAVFGAPYAPAVLEVVLGQGLELAEDGALVLRREIAVSGGGRVFINGSPATVAALRELGGRLLELHGQHEHHSLCSVERQQEILDRFGAHDGALEAVRQGYRDAVEARRRLELLEAAARDRDQQVAELRRQIREIEAVSPRPGEREALELERRRLRHAGEIAELLAEAVSQLYEGEPSGAALACAAARRVARLAELDPALGELARRIEAARLELQDAGAALRDYRDRADFDPARLEEVERRRAAIDRLCSRHGVDDAELLALRDRARGELEQLEHLGEDRDRAAAQAERAAAAYAAACAELSAARQRAVARLVPAVRRQLEALALARARFEVGVVVAPGPQVGDRWAGLPLHARGAERVEFRIATNPGEEPRPLARIASGGELSRIMLALHVVARSGEEGRSVVFDEVDAGVGGATADAVGARLAGLARRCQVLCVTHLPQVAAYADHHYHVAKRVVGGRTRVEVGALSEDGRVDELARMLGGRRVSAGSRKNAAELLAAASALRLARSEGSPA
jgi:DNA repair protein RecN (Recombination protein N)